MARARRLLACAVVLAALTPAHAADAPTGTPWRVGEWVRQWKPGVPESDALRVPQPITRDEQVQEVLLKEAIALALASNPGIAARRLEPFGQAEGVLGAQAVFDPTLSGEVEQHHSRTPNASSLAGTRTLKVDDRFANLHLFKTFRTGTIATIDSLNERVDNNALFNQLRPEYTASLNFSLVQPLLRDFGWDFTYLVVRVAERNADAALFDYEAALADFVTEVIETYWTVVRARETLEVQRESLALARRTTEENDARVKVGLLPPVASLEAQADAKSREADVITAENNLAIARQQLAQLAFYRPDGTFVPRTLEPIEEAVPEEVRPDLENTLATALAERPEVHASAHGVEVQQLNTKIAGNALLPRVDLVGGYGVNSLSGRTRQVSTPQTVVIDGPIDPALQRLINQGRCSLIPTTRTEPRYLCLVPRSGPVFAGTHSDVYDRLTTNEFKTYSFGVQFQVPLSNAAARSQYARSRIARDQAELNHRELLSRVTLEVRQAISDVTTGLQRIDATRIARELAEENLKNQQKRHEVGMATTKDLLDFQTRLTTARAAEVAAKIDHAIAVAHWRRAQGRLLRFYQVVVEHPGRRSAPWFARF
jgi:outer membrane protein